MNVNNETIKLIEQHKLPSYNEIPNVGLYLEQTAKFINEYLEPIMDTVITGSMISNYVKKKLVANPVKKMYYRDHITQLIVIAIMKSVVSLDQVKMILQMEEEGITEETYNRFSKEFDYALKKSFNLEPEHVDSKHENNMETILGDIVNLVAHKVYIDKLLASLE